MTAEGTPAEANSKDRFFERLGRLAEEMIAAHGRDFTMGTLVLAARFIAEGKPLARNVPQPDDTQDT
jgi:hypothetical protein